MPAASARFVGARTAFGIIVKVENRLFNAQAVVRASDGSESTYRLPFLLALGVTFSERIQA